MLKRLTLCLLAVFGATSMSWAVPVQDLVSARLLPGWRTERGTHIAGLVIDLAPGWKTYWRAPGDAGIPPSFDWTGSQGVQNVRYHWPVPEVVNTNGMRVIGYSQQLVLPIEVDVPAAGDVVLKGSVDLGICADVCIPVSLKLDAALAPAGPRDPRLVAALIDQPQSGPQAGLASARCDLAARPDGLALTVRLDLPRTGQQEVLVVETGRPDLWVSSTTVKRDGRMLTGTAQIQSLSGKPMVLDRGALRLSVMGGNRMVDIRGCQD